MRNEVSAFFCFVHAFPQGATQKRAGVSATAYMRMQVLLFCGLPAGALSSLTLAVSNTRQANM